MEFPDHTITIAGLLCVVLISIAGCATDLGEETRTTTVETPGTTTIAEETETTKQQTTAETTTERRTTTIDYTRGLPYELRIANYREEKVEVSVRIETDNGTAIYNDTVTIPTNTTEEYNLTFPEAGSYVIVANTTKNTESSQWRVVSKDPDEAASVVLAKDGDLQVSVVTT
jgi:hypothetical protein